ncbi:MAG: cyclase family protein [Eubacteriales bacterium]|nr:cyclase family protein [Eubacteriales bacterium]
MKIYDISQEIFGCAVYPGDPAPGRQEVMRIAQGAACNLTAFSMCAHNGTHIDAPYHFLEDGETVDRIPLEKTVGTCYVSEQNEELDTGKAQEILQAAGEIRRILLKGKCIVTEEAAKVFADAGIWLLGVESQTVGPESGPMAVHKVLLGAKIVIVEGLCLSEVEAGTYFLNAAPINLGGTDGAPCRAILIDER